MWAITLGRVLLALTNVSDFMNTTVLVFSASKY